MPNRRYHARNPPTRVDHALAHPYGIPIAVYTLFAAAMMLAQTITTHAFTASPSVNALPWWLAGSIGVLGATSGIYMLRGLLHGGDDLMDGWRLERVGLILGATTWWLYAGAVFVEHPGSLVSWLSGLTIGGAHALRYVATVIEERHSRAAIARSTGGA